MICRLSRPTPRTLAIFWSPEIPLSIGKRCTSAAPRQGSPRDGEQRREHGHLRQEGRREEGKHGLRGPGVQDGETCALLPRAGEPREDAGRPAAGACEEAAPKGVAGVSARSHYAAKL